MRSYPWALLARFWQGIIFDLRHKFAEQYSVDRHESRCVMNLTMVLLILGFSLLVELVISFLDRNLYLAPASDRPRVAKTGITGGKDDHTS